MDLSREKIIEEVEKRIGVSFEDKCLLDIALTHSSYTNHKKNIKYNERLEFLGDAVLELSVSQFLFKKYNNKTEGELTKIRSLVVCENSLHSLAEKWELGKYMNMGRGEELTGGRTRVSILSDCVEAIIAAVYLEKGFEITKNFVIRILEENIFKAVKNKIILDYKTKLQEKLQQNGEINICYDLIGYDGPPHRRKFYMQVFVNDKSFGKGMGYSKKEAEQNAAKEALSKLGGD